MGKMTDADFRYNLDVLMTVLDKQPNLFTTDRATPPGAKEGEKLAEMVFAFVERFQEIHKQKVS